MCHHPCKWFLPGKSWYRPLRPSPCLRLRGERTPVTFKCVQMQNVHEHGIYISEMFMCQRKVRPLEEVRVADRMRSCRYRKWQKQNQLRGQDNCIPRWDCITGGINIHALLLQILTLPSFLFFSNSTCASSNQCSDCPSENPILYGRELPSSL